MALGAPKSLIQEKTHFTLQGPGESGKSHTLDCIDAMKTPGTVQKLTHSSTLAATLDMDCFNTIVQEHEQSPECHSWARRKQSHQRAVKKAGEIRKNMKTLARTPRHG